LSKLDGCRLQGKIEATGSTRTKGRIKTRTAKLYECLRRVNCLTTYMDQVTKPG
jgi:hypothetical protein